jgi:hypothetical protein
MSQEDGRIGQGKGRKESEAGKRKKKEKEKVPPRFELGFRDSESLVLTATLWNQVGIEGLTLCQLL